MKKPKIIAATSIIALLCLLLLPSHKAEEGMFPLNLLNENQLQSAGLKLNAKDIFNPGGVSLTNALVKVGGCTGSFISDEGLIITNHHCVSGGVAKLSSEEHNYLEHGFVAKTRDMELSINMPCRITQSYEDVSARVLEGIDDKTDPQTRSRIIGENIEKIRKEEGAKTPDLTVEISEMFVGKSYSLFRYLLITDVRLVYAPPLPIGQFGGDLDNWEWPRHNADFGLVRAYVGKDGKPATYSKDNIPYKPFKHLKISPTGVKENDFVFIMGYPGRTFRHESAPYLKFQQDFQLPEIQKWYQWCSDEMTRRGKEDISKSLAFAGNVQQLSNVEKNFRGKIQGLTRTNLVQKKYDDEDAMHQFAIKTGNYVNVIPDLRTLWNRKSEIAARRYNYFFLNTQSSAFQAANRIVTTSNVIKNSKNSTEKKKATELLQSYMRANYSIIDQGYEMAMVSELTRKLASVSNMKSFLGKMSSDEWIKNELQTKEKLFDTGWTMNLARNKISKLAAYKGPLTRIIEFINSDMSAVESEWISIDNQIRALMPKYLDLKHAFKASQFIPDANSTLRLTYGYIKGYSPKDAELHLPFTTLRGVFEKANTAPDYRLPKVLADNLRIENVPPFFKDPNTGEVVICMLYNMDTTGGNSGSPILDGNGYLVGVNFDRSFTATINDYAWNEKYSRSIGVDIRYVIYVMKYISKADHLIKEMGIVL